MDNESADVTLFGRSFQVYGPTIEKAQLSTIVNLTEDTDRQLVIAEQQNRQKTNNRMSLPSNEAQLAS